MTSDPEKEIIDLVQKENQKLGNKYLTDNFSLLAKPKFKEQVKDSTSIFKINGREPRDDSILTLSNNHFPESVYEAIEKVEMITSIVGPRLSNNILRPSSTGIFRNRSYAFWPIKKIISNNKINRKIQIQSVHSQVFQWFCDMSSISRLAINSDVNLSRQYIDPLIFLVDKKYIPKSIKTIANVTLRALDTNNFVPVSVAQHGDLWHGNILLEKTWPYSLCSPVPFFIIDWGGANVQGYPYVDQLRYLKSIDKGDRAVAKHLSIYSKCCSLSECDIVNYTCAYAGHLGMNRGEFPIDRYLALVSEMLESATAFKYRFANA